MITNYENYYNTMINSSSRKAADHNTPKQEDKTTTSTGATKIVSKTAAAAAASSSWSRLKDPRIVRVSRAFGGKDRHSKVCTVRGLRDRRVRLSVPTAIQLYDLQDRLNLNQPSKVIDWLLNAAKDDIDQLPPLQMPPADLVSQFHLPLISSTTTNTNTCHHHRLIAHDQDPNSLTGLLNNVMPAAHNSSSFLRWDPSNLSLSHPDQNFNFVPILPSTSSTSMPSGAHQFVVYPPTAGDFDPRQMINFQMLSSSTSTSQNSPLSNSSFSNPPLYPIGQAMRSPFHLSMNPFGTGAAPNKD